MQLFKRGNVYTCRVWIPADLRDALGRVEILRSTRTGDMREAQRRASLWQAHLSTFLHTVRARGRTMSRDQLDTLTHRYLSTRFDEIESALSLDWTASPTVEAGRDVWGDDLADQCEVLTAALARGDFAGVMDDARSMLPDADDDTQRKLARRLLEAQLEAHKATLRALSGEPLVFPSLASATASAVPTAARKETPRLWRQITRQTNARPVCGLPARMPGTFRPSRWYVNCSVIHAWGT